MKLIFSIFAFVLVVQQGVSQKNIYDVARKGTLSEAKILISEKPNLVNTKNEQGFSPLLLAVYYSNEEVAKYLVESGAEVDENSSMGSPLMAAVVKNNLILAELLLKKGASVDATDANGTTSLIYAVTFQLKPMLELLLSYKPTISHQDDKGFSALDYAKKLNNKEIIQLLE